MPRKKSTKKRTDYEVMVANLDRYWLHLNDAELEHLTDAVCPESVALKCWEALKWRREAHRNGARAQVIASGGRIQRSPTLSRKRKR